MTKSNPPPSPPPTTFGDKAQAPDSLDLIFRICQLAKRIASDNVSLASINQNSLDAKALLKEMRELDWGL